MEYYLKTGNPGVQSPGLWGYMYEYPSNLLDIYKLVRGFLTSLD